jgi:anti-sigma-K factor RskA
MSDIHALSGAYAVDALDDIERAAFERHLTECAECRAEVASLREAASLLGETEATEPPAALRDRVLAGISTVRPLPPAVEPPAPRRHGRRLRLASLAAAAAVIAALGVGGAVWHPWTDQHSDSQNVADTVFSATDVHSDTVGRAVLVTRKMPPPPSGKVYQLWLQQPGQGMVSAGVMPVKPDQTVILKGDAATATAAGITVEPEGGSSKPTTAPIALFDFGRDA